MFRAPAKASIAKVIRVAQFFPSFIDEEGNDLLMPLVSKDEVEVILKSMQKEKSSGPDGWTVEFFLHFFDALGKDLTVVVEESRVSGLVYQPFNATFLTLIPKSDHPSSFNDFRPISLCTCLYKVIAKIVASKLKPFLSKNISLEQFGFLDGRQIHEFVRVAQETLHSLKKSRKKGAIIKIDLSKAYDRISWMYLRLLLTHLGFRYDFVRWIMGCVSSTSIVLLIGVASIFSILKGVSTRDVLSPHCCSYSQLKD